VSDDENTARRARFGEVFDVAPGAHEPIADLAAAAGAQLHPRPRVRRRWAAWLALFAAIFAGAGGTAALSASHGLQRFGPVLVMAGCYLVCFVALTRALKVIPIGTAYAVWSGLGITLVTAIGWGAFGQHLNAGQLVGVALILAGVVLIQRWSRAVIPGEGGGP
jgi:multidrug transporter EmrE-like cation transporter